MSDNTGAGAIGTMARKVHGAAGMRNRLPAGRRRPAFTRKGKRLDGAGSPAVAGFPLFSRNPPKDLGLPASVFSVFDKKYDNTGGAGHTQPVIEQNGRTFRVKAACRSLRGAPQDGCAAKG